MNNFEHSNWRCNSLCSCTTPHFMRQCTCILGITLPLNQFWTIQPYQQPIPTLLILLLLIFFLIIIIIIITIVPTLLRTNMGFIALPVIVTLQTRKLCSTTRFLHHSQLFLSSSSSSNNISNNKL